MHYLFCITSVIVKWINIDSFVAHSWQNYNSFKVCWQDWFLISVFVTLFFLYTILPNSIKHSKEEELPAVTHSISHWFSWLISIICCFEGQQLAGKSREVMHEVLKFIVHTHKKSLHNWCTCPFTLLDFPYLKFTVQNCDYFSM